ncbi:MAG: M60 family metallopeptidase, partial [Marinilabilia sp.]
MKNIFHLSIYVLFLVISFSSCKDDDTAPENNKLEINEDNKEIGFEASSASRNISIKTNAEELEVDAADEWCNASFDSQNNTLTISVLDNKNLQARTSFITISHGSLSEKVEITQFGVEPQLFLSSEEIKTDYEAKTITIDLMSNVDVIPNCEEASWITKSDNKKGVTIEPVEYSFDFNIEALPSDEIREGTIFFEHTEGDLEDSILVKQSLVTSDDYNPESTEAFEEDKKINVLSATLDPSDKFHPEREIDKSIDGDMSTLYHSPWEGMPDQPDITLEYSLDPEDAEVLNYLVLHPTTSGANGIIKTATIWVKTEENNEYTKVADFEAPRSNNPQVVQFDSPIMNPRSVKLVVTDAYTHDPGKYYVSLAEFECYESKSLNAIEDDKAFFTDETFSKLKAGFSVEDISKISNPFLQNIAAYLLSENYDQEFRVQHYKAFQPVNDLANELKTSGYSQFENPTGIYFEEGDEVILFVEDPQDQNIHLKVKDFGRSGDDHTYNLRRGLNIVTMQGSGNGYISYYTPDYEFADPLKIHIASGQVNGYFDISKHSNDDGKQLLDNAVSEIMDIKGERVQLAYSVSDLRNNADGRLGDLTVVYDSIISSEQRMMGLYKHNRLPDNHILGRVIWEGYMHADGLGAAYHTSTMEILANPDRLKNNIWGPAHEFGHVNQTRPGFKWVGTAEVTNNIFSHWLQFCYTPHNMRLEHETIDGKAGGRYTRYFKDAFINNYEWGLQGDTYGPNENDAWGGDVFVSLIPMWQIHLFFHVAGEGNDWHTPYPYADVFEAVRNTDESNLSQGQLQLNWIKYVCDAVERDLTDFFTDIGMLQEVDKVFGDYSDARKTITTSMIDETISYISQYPKPELNNTIKFISVNSYQAFK